MLTIELLRKKGCKVRVTHYRYLRIPLADHLPDEIKKAVPKVTSLMIARAGANWEVTPEGYHVGPASAACPKGGITFVEVTMPCGKSFLSYAICAEGDLYCRKTGIQIALRPIGKTKYNEVTIGGWALQKEE